MYLEYKSTGAGFLLSDIVIILLLIIVKGIVICCSTSVSVLEIKKAKYTSDKDDPNSKKISAILDNSQKYTNATGVMNALLAIIIGFMIGFSLMEDVVPKLNAALDTGVIISQLLAAVILIAAATYFFSLFSIIVPKNIAHKMPDKVVLKLNWLMKLICVVFKPFMGIIDVSCKIFNIFADDEYDIESDVSENEILMMVDAGGESGSIDEHEMEMINNIFDFDDRNAEEIATHRKEIVAVPIDISVDELINVITTEKFSRIPVYEEDIDNIVGILHIRDFINVILEKGKDSFNIRDIIMEPFFVPSTKKADSLFEEMQKKKVHMAVVADEYGGTAGIITMEDLIEEVMGEIQDEYDEEEQPEITELTEKVTIIEGSTSLDDVAEKLEIEMPVDEYDTLAGFLVGLMDKIPEEKDVDTILEYKGYIFRLDKIEDKRIAIVTVIKKEEEQEDENENI